MPITPVTRALVYIGCAAVYIVLMVILHKCFPKLPRLARRFIAAGLLIVIALVVVLLL